MISTIITTTSTVSIAQVINYSIISVTVLIVFLALKEILKGATTKNSKIKSFVEGSNIVIVPFLVVFASIVAYKVVTVI